MAGRISVAELRNLYNSDEEFALLDVRELGDFQHGHLLAASNLPLSRLELGIERAVPRRETQIILCDRPSAPRAVSRLTLLGYSNVVCLEGGLSGWALDGGKLFAGVNVIGKAFGEYIEQQRQTPSITAMELKALLESEQPPLLLDTRTPEEHSDFCIPGALSCPNGELAYRALAKIDSDEQLIVAHCAGRTRSIIGAQALIDTGIPNRVAALENGTLAWQFANLDLERGANRPLLLPGTDDLTRSRQAAHTLCDRFGVQTIEMDTLEQWRDESVRKTLYVIDVRSPEEFARSTLPEAVHVPGGQLVQNVDDYLVTRNARVVLLDTDGVRSIATAAWLNQLGFKNVVSLTVNSNELSDNQDETMTGVELPRVHAGALREAMAAGSACVLDIRRSVDYRRAHIPGSWFLTRACIDTDVEALPRCGANVLVTDDHAYAALVAADLERLGHLAKVLAGGINAWADAGLPLESGLQNLASEPNDTVLFGSDYDEQSKDFREGRAYLEWEIGLVHQLEDDPGAPYIDQLPK